MRCESCESVKEAHIAIVGLALSIISIVPIAAGACYWLLRYSIARKFLRFTGKGPVDFVLTTSAMHISGRQYGAKVRRPVTGIGQIQGTAFASEAIGDLYRRKQIRVHLSVDVRNVLDEDLLIIGGPAKNAVARQFFDCLPVSSGGNRAVFDDINGTILMPAGFGKEWAVNVAMDLETIRFVPTEDWGVVILCKNPFTTLARRAIFISGFTSYGTAATAEYLFGSVIRRSWRSMGSAKIPREVRNNRGLFGFVIHITFSSGRAIAFSDPQWFGYTSS